MSRRSGLPATLTRKVRLLLNEWKSGEIKSGWEISAGQLELACDLGFLVLVKDAKSATQREYNRTSQSVRLGKSPKVPRLGPRQKEVLLMLALNELRGKQTYRWDMPGKGITDPLERYGFIEQDGQGGRYRIAGSARREYLLKAAIEVLVLEGTKVERSVMNRLRDAANKAIPEEQVYEGNAADFERQAKRCYEAAKAYRRAQQVHRKAAAAVKPSKEEALARVLVHEMGESESDKE